MRRSPALLLACFAFSLVGCASIQRPTGEHHELRLGMARQLVAHRDWRGAFEMLNALHRELPENAEVLTLRGVVYREHGLFVEAREDLQHALRLAPDMAAAHSALGILLDLTGDALARAHHRRAVELEGENAAYLNNLAFSDFAHGRLVEATAGFEHALRLDPTNARIRNNLGFALARAGAFARASEQFERAAGPVQARHNLALAHELAGNLAAALGHYEAAMRLGASEARVGLERVAARASSQSAQQGTEAGFGEERR